MKYWNLVSSCHSLMHSSRRRSMGSAEVAAGYSCGWLQYKQLWKQTRPWALESSRDGEEFQYTLDRLISQNTLSAYSTGMLNSLFRIILRFLDRGMGAVFGAVSCDDAHLTTAESGVDSNGSMGLGLFSASASSSSGNIMVPKWKTKGKGEGGGEGILKQQ